MTIFEYTQRLGDALEGSSPDEIESAVQYYTELIEDSDDPEGQMERLGEPEALAERIKRESGWIQPAEPDFDENAENSAPPPTDFVSGYQTPPPNFYGGEQTFAKKKDHGALRGALVVLTFPLWFTALVILAVMIPTIWAVYICFPAAALAFAFDGLFRLSEYTPLALVELSCVPALIGLSVLLVRPLKALTVLTCKAIKWLCLLLFAPAKLNSPRPERQKKPTSRAAKLVTVVSAAVTLGGLALCAVVTSVARPSQSGYFKTLGLKTSEFALDDAQEITINVAAGDITVCKSPDGKSKFVAKNIYPDDLEVAGDLETTIIYKSDHARHLVDLYPFTDEQSHFELYLPEEKIKNLAIENDLGNVKVKDLPLGDLDISLDCGDISLKNITASGVKLNNDLGEITAEGINADKMSVENSSGSIKISNAAITGKVSGELSLGDAEFKNVTFGLLDMRLDCGDFDFSGKLTESDSEINLDLGSVTMELDGEYNVYATCDLGDVEVNEKYKKGSGNIITITNNSGDITVE